MLTLWRESYDQPRQHIKKQRHYFVFKGLSILAMAIKKAEHRRIDAFELCCWWRLLKVPWTARRSNQSILRRSVLGVHWKDWCWSWNSNTLGTWCKELTHLKRSWCWERLRAGGEEDDRRSDGWMASLTRWTWVWVNSGSWWWTGRPGMVEFMGSQRVRHDWVTERNGIELKLIVHHAKCQAGWSTSWSKIFGRNINNLRYADDTTLWQKVKKD